MAAQAGYSGTPLPKKLGLKDGQYVLFINLPDSQKELAKTRRFAHVSMIKWDELMPLKKGYDVIHGFTMSQDELNTSLERLQSLITPDGTIWISWPKKASKVETDITEDVVRAQALALDLVDVKVCAVDAIWSGLKLVIRKEKRHLHG